MEKLEVYIEGTTNPIQPIDLEISAVDNKVWVSSTRDFSGNGAEEFGNRMMLVTTLQKNIK